MIDFKVRMHEETKDILRLLERQLDDVTGESYKEDESGADEPLIHLLQQEIKKLERELYDLERDLIQRQGCICDLKRTRPFGSCKCKRSQKRMANFDVTDLNTPHKFLTQEQLLQQLVAQVEKGKKEKKAAQRKNRTADIPLEIASTDESGNLLMPLVLVIVVLNCGMLAGAGFHLTFNGTPVLKSKRHDGLGLNFDFGEHKTLI